MERALFSRVPLPAERIHFLRGDAADPEKECRRYERDLRRSGAPHLALAGIGVNGHVAYLERARARAPHGARQAAATRRASPPTGSVPSRAKR
jgi:glucosamine-6-phosphate deaminase